MDFLRRLFRGQQHDQRSFSNTQSTVGTDEAVVEDTALVTESEHPDGDGTDRNGVPADDHDHAGNNNPAWWEDSQPLVESVQPVDSVIDSASGIQERSRSDEHISTTHDGPTEPLTMLISQDNIADSPQADLLDSAAEQTDTPSEEQKPADQTEPASDSDEEEVEYGTHKLSLESVPALIAQQSQRGLAVSVLRDVGRIRQINQDSVFALLTTLPREGTDVSLGLFVVADGMGGHDGGEVASRLAIRTVAHEILSQLVIPALDDTITEALQPLMISAVQEANRVIWEHAQSVSSDMGTTCTAVLLLGRALYIAHVGDSRAYLLEAGGLRTLTDDHSAVGRLIQLGQLDPSEAREHPLRSQLYRTVGQQPQVQVDFIYHRLDESSHLLVCSDGLWGMISEEQMQQTLLHYTWPQDACHELIALANLAGGEDNISAVVVTLPSAERPL